jgi:hypothetical protein
MYRREVHRTLRFGSFAPFIELQKEKNKLLAEAGCTPYRVWSPAFGELHHLVLEATFPSLAAYEEEGKVIAGLGRISGIDGEQIQFVMPGTAADRLSKVVLEPGTDS